jgi:hypothetical protein
MLYLLNLQEIIPSSGHRINHFSENSLVNTLRQMKKTVKNCTEKEEKYPLLCKILLF